MRRAIGSPQGKHERELIERGLLEENFVHVLLSSAGRPLVVLGADGQAAGREAGRLFPTSLGRQHRVHGRGGNSQGRCGRVRCRSVHLGCVHLIERSANIFTLLHRPEPTCTVRRSSRTSGSAVLAKIMRRGRGCRCSRPTATRHSAAAMAMAEDLFYHIMAVLWSPAYRKENEAALRQDWPRVPIPADRGLLSESAAVGSRGGRSALARPARPWRDLRHDPAGTASAGRSQQSRRREYRSRRGPQGRGHMGFLRRQERRDVRQGQDRAQHRRSRAAPWTSTSTIASIGRTCRWTCGR